jgi:hypothetical protein
VGRSWVENRKVRSPRKAASRKWDETEVARHHHGTTTDIVGITTSLPETDIIGTTESDETTWIESTTAMTANEDAPRTRSHGGTETENARETATDTQTTHPLEITPPTSNARQKTLQKK